MESGRGREALVVRQGPSIAAAAVVTLTPEAVTVRGGAGGVRRGGDSGTRGSRAGGPAP